jgi:hypothetical protein
MHPTEREGIKPMSKGTPNRVVRIDDDLWTRMEFQVMSLRIHSKRVKWDQSEFIRVACEEKLDKMRRSRESKRK